MKRSQKSTTDVFMGIEAEDANEIARGKRTHEYRNHPLPTTVERIWLYSKAPMKLIEYVLSIAHNDTEPVQINGELRYAYEIHQVWMLRRPIGILEASQMGALTRAPGKYSWVPNNFLEAILYQKQYHLKQK
jgi:hypothetical protein